METMNHLTINEIYTSVQGESSYAGIPCTFVRLTGCDLRCNYCDTEYAFHEGKKIEISDVIQEVLDHGTDLVEITGGEPLLQRNVSVLMQGLLDQGKTVLVETSGSQDISICPKGVVRIMDLKCPSSGESEKNNWQNIARLSAKDEVKFVIADQSDFDWAIGVVREHKLLSKAHVLFSHSWNTLPGAELAKWVVETKLPIRFQTQLHKMLWGEKRGT
jgi:7-carboxy-7-deazaguanine synthase